MKKYKKCQLKGCEKTLTGKQRKYCCKQHNYMSLRGRPYSAEKKICLHPDCDNEIVGKNIGRRKYCCPEHGYACRHGLSIHAEPAQYVSMSNSICTHCKKPLGKNRDVTFCPGCREKHKKMIRRKDDSPILG